MNSVLVFGAVAMMGLARGPGAVGTLARFDVLYEYPGGSVQRQLTTDTIYAATQPAGVEWTLRAREVASDPAQFPPSWTSEWSGPSVSIMLVPEWVDANGDGVIGIVDVVRVAWNFGTGGRSVGDVSFAASLFGLRVCPGTHNRLLKREC